MPKGRGRKDSDSDAGTDEQGTVGTFETLRDEGEHFVHVKQYGKAIESFTKALDMKNGDRTCLVVRSKCYLMLGNSDKALTDADAAIAADDDEGTRKDIRALNMKAEALYQKGDFENALMFYHRGNKQRPELQEFRLGIQKCEEAIDNSIGSPNSVHLEATGDLTYFYKQDDSSMDKNKQKGYTKVNPNQKKEEKKEYTRPQTNTDPKTTKELLGELYRDKDYLDRFLVSLENCSTEADFYIKGRVHDGLLYLENRSEFWQQQKPLYARKRDRKSRSAQGSAGRKGGDPMNYILVKLEEIDQAQSEGHYNESLDKCKMLMRRVDDMSDSSLKKKPEVTANIYSIMGNCYLEKGKFGLAKEYHEKDLDIARAYYLDEAESRALDNLGRTSARMGDYREAIDIWKKKLPKSKSAVESTWLYHEIGRCHLELGEYQDAKDDGEKSVAAAKEADDLSWQLHGHVLVAQSEVKCGEYEAASDSFTIALDLSEELEDKQAQNAIKKALAEVNEKIVKGEQQATDDEDERLSGKSDHEQDSSKDKKDSDQEGKKSPESPKETKSTEKKGEETTESDNKEEYNLKGAKGKLEEENDEESDDPNKEKEELSEHNSDEKKTKEEDPGNTEDTNESHA